MEFDLYSNHILNSSEETLGFDAENQSENITINIKDLNLIDKWAYLEFETDEKHKYITERLDIVDNKIVYPLPNGLLKYGYVKFQVVFRYNNNWSWKSNEKSVFVRHSINASTGYPEQYPDFIGEAQEVLNKTEEALEQIEGFEQGILERVDTVEQKVENFEQEMHEFEQAEAQRVVNEGVRQTNEQTRQSNELERVQNENERKQNETARQQAESQRQTTFETNEQARQATFNSNEQARQQVFEQKESQREENELQRQANESSRIQSETQRTQNENSRVSAENARIIAENNRVSQESTRQTQESSRVNAEALRTQNETARQTAETTRENAEASRNQAETIRESNEVTREQNEATRIANEEARVQAETDRANEFATWEDEIDSKADKEITEKVEANLQYEIADLKAKLYETVVGVKQLKTEYASEIDIPTHITEDSVAYPVLDNTAMEVANIKGHTLKWNQLLQNPDFISSGANWSAYYYGGSTSWSGGILTIRKSDGTCDISQALSSPIPVGHKILITARLKTKNGNYISFAGTGWSTNSFVSKTTFDTYYKIIDLTNNIQRIYIACYGTEDVEMSVDYVYLIDLTQMFGSGNEPTSVDDSRVQWAIDYATKHPEYDAGSLKNVNVEKLESFTANVWDEEWERGGFYYSGGYYNSKNTIRSINYINVEPNKNYYVNMPSQNGSTEYPHFIFYDINKNIISVIDNKTNSHTFITPNNCHYIKFDMGNIYGTTYNHDISIYKGSTDLGYIPYKKLGSLTLPNIDLRGVNNIQDDLTFVEQEDGTYNLEHTKYIENYSFTGSEDWNYYDAGVNSFFYLITPSGVSYKINGETITSNGIKLELKESIIRAYLKNNPQLSSSSDMNTIFANGKILDYELATPVKTVIATSLLFDEVSLLINKYGRIEVVNRSADNVNADTTFNVAVKEFKDNE